MAVGANWQTLRPEDRLFIALDVNTLDEVKQIVSKFGTFFRSYKIGLQLFSQEGPRVIEWLHENGCRVFADLKFHDIPNTVAGAAAAMTRLGVYMFNVHCAGGKEMMARTVESIQTAAAKENRKDMPLVLGVTQLTSTSQQTLEEEIGIQLPMEQAVVRYAALAKEGGLNGVVASAAEARTIRQQLGSEFVILTPGIRPLGSDAGDQTRITTPADAVKNGSDFLVVGRPILNAEDPLMAARSIVQEMETAIKSR